MARRPMRPPPADEAEQAEGHEQAGVGLGNDACRKALDQEGRAAVAARGVWEVQRQAADLVPGQRAWVDRDLEAVESRRVEVGQEVPERRRRGREWLPPLLPCTAAWRSAPLKRWEEDASHICPPL